MFVGTCKPVPLVITTVELGSVLTANVAPCIVVEMTHRVRPSRDRKRHFQAGAVIGHIELLVQSHLMVFVNLVIAVTMGRQGPLALLTMEGKDDAGVSLRHHFNESGNVGCLGVKLAPESFKK